MSILVLQIILMGKRELVALLNLSSWCLVMVEWLFLAVPRGCLWFVIVVFPDYTHYYFLWIFFFIPLCFYSKPFLITDFWGKFYRLLIFGPKFY